MEQRIIFRQLLNELKELADEQGGSIDTGQVDAYLQEAGLTAQQLEMVYAYLAEQKIRVDGYSPSEPQPGREQSIRPETVHGGGQTEPAGEEKEEEANGLDAYLEELSGISSLDPVLEESLFHMAAEGDKEARNTLVHAYLGVVCDMAAEMQQDSLHVEDLIQEGNMGLLVALDHLEKRDTLAAYQAQLMNTVAASMREAVERSADVRRMDEGMAVRVNRLNEEILKLKEELGHEISAMELSAYLNMPVQEILNILKLAGDEMKQ